MDREAPQQADAADKALRVARRELKWWQSQFEHATESLHRTRRQRARLREQVQALSDALATTLSEQYWASRRDAPRLGRLLPRPGAGQTPEADLVREVEGSDLFDGGWYLRTYPDVARSGTAPAVDYVQHGNRLGRDPGPGFSTTSYLERHPEVRSGLPALVHAVRNGNLDEPAPDGPAGSPADDLHL